MLRADREAQPAPRPVAARLIRKFAFEHEQLAALLIGDAPKFRFRLPALEAHPVREPRLLVERPCRRRPRCQSAPEAHLVGIDGHVAPFPAGKLPQLHEERAAGPRRRGVPKAFPELEEINCPAVQSAAVVAAIEQFDITNLIGLTSPAGRELLPRIAADWMPRWSWTVPRSTWTVSG